jgi:ABC-2 type transport system permease protein
MAWLGTYTGIHTVSAKEEVSSSVSLPVTLPVFGKELPIPWGAKKTVETPMHLKVDAKQLFPATLNLFSLGVTLAGIATFVSACDRYRWRTIGIVTSLYVVQILLKLIGMASDSWYWLKWLSFLTAYEPEEFVNWSMRDPQMAWSFTRLGADGTVVGLGPLGYDLLLIGIGLVSYLLAAIVFQRRDLPAPT